MPRLIEPAPGTDVHYDIVRLGAPPDFESPSGDITFASRVATHVGPGKVRASVAGVGGELIYDDPLEPGEVREYMTGTPGRLISEDEYGIITPVGMVSPSWSADGAYVTNEAIGDPQRRHVGFRLSSVTVRFADALVAYTREIHRGPRIEYFRGFTGNGRGGATADRLEGRALGRRTTLRDLRTSDDNSENLIAIVYDGEPHEGNASQALWLGASLLAGQNLQPVVVENYDAQGVLLSRRYRLGAPAAASADPPFHVHYAPFDPNWLELIVDGIAGRLEDKFPIDVVIAHLHDATDGAMERRMQSYLLALHAGSEAWNRRHGQTTIIDKQRWAVWSARIGSVAGFAAGLLNADLGNAVRAKIGDANNTGTGARMRAFCSAMGLAFAGADKKAVDLRNVLFHDGYLQRRFSTLTNAKQQERLDQIDRLRDFTYRAMFSLIGFGGTFHGALHQYAAISVRNVETEPQGQAAR